jgi:predicted ATPase/DNA-binding winged helix-turn-helix (wHTH) protein
MSITNLGPGKVLFEEGFQVGAFRLFPAMPCLCRGEKVVHLTPTALRLLIILVERHGNVVSKNDLMKAVWFGCSVDENNLATHIGALRRTLGNESIKTIHGRGYQLAVAVTPLGNEEEPPSSAPVKEAEVAPPRRTNLLERHGGLIGRHAEVADLEGIVERSRLVTLLGPGGVGKTSLALRLGVKLLPKFVDGVWLIDVAQLSDLGMIRAATAAVLNITLQQQGDPLEALGTGLRQRQCLLIYDNCEYVAQAVGDLVDALLARAPGLHVLATSQEQLRCSAERIYRLLPLAVPPAGATQTSEFPAVQLFAERAQAANHQFTINSRNAKAVGEVCRRLDGIPLALQMAAALLPLLGIEGIRASLDDRLDMLTSAIHTNEPRHLTIRAMMEWSHGLLDPADQIVFRRLGVFPSNFSLEAATAVIEPALERTWPVRHALGRLVAKSLVIVESEEPLRFRLLESVRLFSVERLEASGERDTIVERHARYYIEYFERAIIAWQMVSDKAWVAAYAPELDNLRAALNWALAEPHRAQIAVALAGPAAFLWRTLEFFDEGRRFVDRAIPVIDQDTPPESAARLLSFAGQMWIGSDRERGFALLERSVAFYRQINDRLGFAPVLGTIGVHYAYRQRYADAQAALDEAQEILVGHDRKKSLFTVLHNRGILANLMDQSEGAEKFFAQALELALDMKCPTREGYALLNLAVVRFDTGNIDGAVKSARESVNCLRQAERPASLGWALNTLASFLIFQDRLSEARPVAEEGFLLSREEGGHVFKICLQNWALLGSLEGRHVAAAYIIGFVDAGFVAAKTVRQPSEQQIYELLYNRLEAKLPVSDILAHGAQGARWTEAQAADFACARLIRSAVPD